MKRSLWTKVLVVLLALVMLFSLSAFVVTAANNASGSSKATTEGKAKRRTYTQALDDVKAHLEKIKPTGSFWDKGKNQLKEFKNYEAVGVSLIQNGFEFFSDPSNADYMEIGMELVKAGVNVILTCYGIPGGLSDALFDGLMNLGDKPKSEMQILQEHIDEQFEEVNENLTDIQNEMSALSNHVDKAAIISAVASST